MLQLFPLKSRYDGKPEEDSFDEEDEDDGDDDDEDVDGMAACLERLLQPPPRANMSSVQEDVPVEPREERQRGPSSCVESSPRRPHGSIPPTLARDQTEPPPASA